MPKVIQLGDDKSGCHLSCAFPSLQPQSLQNQDPEASQVVRGVGTLTVGDRKGHSACPTGFPKGGRLSDIWRVCLSRSPFCPQDARVPRGACRPLLASHSQCGLFLGARDHVFPLLPASPALPVLSPNRRLGGPRKRRVVRAPSTPPHTPGSPQSACHLPAIPPARPHSSPAPFLQPPTPFVSCLLHQAPRESLPLRSASDRLRGLGWSPGPEARRAPSRPGCLRAGFLPSIENSRGPCWLRSTCLHELPLWPNTYSYPQSISLNTEQRFPVPRV